MNPDQVERLCTQLSPLLKNTIRTKILHYTEPPKDYDFGEALTFWLADLLTGTKIISADQVRLLLEEFYSGILVFGDSLTTAWETKGTMNRKRLPDCKIGFLDRQLVCMDGQNFFLDLVTGKKEAVSETKSLEVLMYNLTTLFVRYKNQMKSSSAELEVKNGRSRPAVQDHHER
jgi:hypothetical protein